MDTLNANNSAENLANLTKLSELAELMFVDIDKTPDFYENMFLNRDLPDGAYVTRIAPSPTGYLHIGVLFTSMIDYITAKKSGGIFYLRLEDTDHKREVAGGAEDIVSGLLHFGIAPDEGYFSQGEEKGAYGPYKQSERKEIYQTYVKNLIKKGHAYPCFCTEEQRALDREKQENSKLRTGYHGEFAHCRILSTDSAIECVSTNQPYVVRLRSNGSEDKRITFDDKIRGKIEMPENDEDIVILKSDGIPTYHFAHAVDDHLMRTTHVIRGEEWLSSVPKHLQLFSMLGFKAPKYAHVSAIMKNDNGSRRKISKRKDPEAAMHYYAKEGYPDKSVVEYLMTVASSEFEQWRRQNQHKHYTEFDFKLKKMSTSGALFDIDKLLDVSKTVISFMNEREVAQNVLEWAKSYDHDYYTIISRDKSFVEKMFAIDRGGKKPRKDIAKWSDTPEYTAFFFDELFTAPTDELFSEAVANEKIKRLDFVNILDKYREVYDDGHDKQQWFDNIKSICSELGFCAEVKQYKANPDEFKGHVGDVSTVIRIALTGRQNSPDLYSIAQLIGKDNVLNRLEKAQQLLIGSER